MDEVIIIIIIIMQDIADDTCEKYEETTYLVSGTGEAKNLGIPKFVSGRGSVIAEICTSV